MKVKNMTAGERKKERKKYCDKLSFSCLCPLYRFEIVLLICIIFIYYIAIFMAYNQIYNYWQDAPLPESEYVF